MGKIEEIINKQVEMFLNEELGIANEVSLYSQDIIRIVKRDIKSKTMQRPYKIDDGIMLKNGRVEIPDLFGVKGFIINYSLYICNDYSLLRNFLSKSSVNFGASISFERKEINLNCLMMDGEIQENTLSDSIYHELEHSYQMIKKNGELMGDKELYSLAAEHLSDSDEMVQTCARIIYYGKNEEINAFANGLYGYIKNAVNLGYSTKQIIDSSDIKQICTGLREWAEYVRLNAEDENMKRACDLFKCTPLKMYKKAEKSFKYAIRQMGRVITKAKKDLFEKQVKDGSMH